MSVYALIDPRTSQFRYVGRSSRPSVRLRQHLRGAHSSGLRIWVDELRSFGLRPELRILRGGTEREWISRLSPDLNILEGEDDDGGNNTDAKTNLRWEEDMKADAEKLATADGRSLNWWIAKACEEKLERDQVKRKATR